MQTFSLPLTTLKAKQQLRLLAAVIALCVIALRPAKLSAQAPNISYAGPQAYTTGAAVTPLSPSNSGGAVTGFGFGSPVSMGTGLQFAGGLITDAAGNLFLVDVQETETEFGTLVYSYYIKAVQASDGATVSLTFDSNRLDRTLAIDPDGYLYLADATGIIKHYYNGGSYDVLTSEIKSTGGIARDASGNLYFNDIGGYVKKLPAGGGDLVTVAEIFNPNAIVVDQQGNLYVSSNAGTTGEKLYKIPAGGGDPVVLDTQGATGLAVDAGGNVYASHTYDGVIVKYAGGTGSPITVLSGLDNPQSITIDASNNLYVITNWKTILKYKPTGGYLISPQLPAGLSLDSNTGVISGTPTVASGATNYTITAYNGSGKNSTTVNIAVNLAPKPAISYTTPLVYTKGTAIADVTPVNTGSAVGSPGYHSQVAVTPSSGPGFSGPVSVAADAAGNLYVGDGGSNSVDKLSAGGGALASQYSIAQPFGIAVDKAGLIYMGDVTAKTVKKVVPGGSATTIASGFNTPMGVAVDLAGNVYVSDSGDGTVKKIVAGTGSVVTLASGFGSANAVAVDAAGNVYVTDGNNNVVKKIAAGSNTSSTIGTGFNRPRSIAVDGAGNVFVADAGNSAIKEILASNGNTTTIATGISNPVGVTTDGAGNVYVADAGSSAVLKLVPSGGYFISQALPIGLSFNSATGVISGTPAAVSAATDYTITAYNITGGNSATTNIIVNFPPDISYSGPQTYLKDVAISPLSPTNSGNAVAAFGYSSNSINVSNGPVYAAGIAISTNGAMYVSDSSSNRVEKYANYSIITVADRLSNPRGIALDAAENLYIADAGHNQIKKAPADGSAIVILGSGFNAPAGVAVDAAGNVYVADAGNNAIKKIPAGSNTPVVIGSGFSNPKGVAVDALGNVYVADTGNGEVKKIPADGSAVVTMLSGLNAPGAIAVDATGNLIIADTENELVKVIPAGSSLPLIIGSGFNKPTGVAVDTKGTVYECEFIPYYSVYGIKAIKPTGGYFINQALPLGLNFDKGTGVISGTPTVMSPATAYTVTAYNSLGSGTATITIGVNLQAPAFSYSSPKVYDAGTAIAALTPANTGGPVAGIAYKNSLSPVTPSGPPGSGFIAPTSIAVDKSGNLFIADAGRATINMLAADGGPLVPITGFGTSLGIAVDNSGNIYASDLSSKTVYKITSGGSQTVVVSGLNQPAGVAVDAAGNVYVADIGDGVVKKVSAGGSTITTIGSGFSQPYTLAVDASGNVYVTDVANNSVKKIVPGNNTPVTVGTGFNTPRGLAVDAAGNLFVADNGNGAVKVILAADGSTITAATGFSNAFSIAVSGAGNIYVTDTGIGGLLKTIPVGGYFVGPFLPQGLAFNSSTGVISGTPLAGSPAADYVVTGYNTGGAGSATLNLTIKPHAPAFSYGSPKVYNAGTAIPALAPSGTGGPVAALAYNNAPVTITPSGPPGSGFLAPLSVAVDKTGNLFVSDAGRGTINEVLAGGSALIPVFTYGTSQGIAIDNNNNLYVSDLSSKSVYKYRLGGSASILPYSFIAPMGVAVDAAGNVYVADAGAGVIKKIPADGSSMVALGSGLGQPFAVAVDAAGNVYVTDSSNNLVKKIAPDNSAPITIGTGFSNPKGLAVDAAGNVFVADAGNHAVKVILASDGSTITAASGFTSPLGITIDGAGNVYTVDNGSVAKITPAGGYFASLFLPKGLAFNSSTGAISGTAETSSPETDYTVTGYNAGGVGSAILKITIRPYSPAISYTGPQTYTADTAIAPLTPVNTGGPVAAIAYNPPTTLTPSASPGLGLVAPLSLAVDKAGNLFIGDAGRAAIDKIAAGGNALTPFTVLGASLGIATDDAGNIYVSDIGSKSVYKITAGGDLSLAASGFNTPLGVTVDPDGNIYVADGGDGVVKKVPADGSSTVTIGSGFSQPFALAVDAAGNVYVTDNSDNLVKKIIPGNSTPVTVGTGFSSPKGLAVDAAGNVFVADNGNHAIKVILAADGSTITLASGLAGPFGIAVDGAGNIYATDNNSVLKINPAGGYFIDPFLPKGLAFSTFTGIISGTPAISSQAMDYTVTAYNTGGSGAATLNIKINQLSHDARLKILSLNPKGALTKIAGSNYADYTANVYGADITSVTLTPTLFGNSATLTINGISATPGVESAPVSLNTDTTAIAVTVTAEDGTTKNTYRIAITRLPSNNALLKILTLNPGAKLTRVTGSNHADYTASVNGSTSSVTLLPVTADHNATLTINGISATPGVESAPVSLNTDTTAIAVTVTAEDGTTKNTYRIAITRLPSNNALLKILTLNPGAKLTRVTGSNHADYTASVNGSTSSVTLLPVTADHNATLTINGILAIPGVESAPVSLNADTTAIAVTVTAEDGTTKNTYRIAITRLPSNNALLKILTLNPGAKLTRVTGSNYADYTAIVSNSTRAVKVKPATADNTATITVNGMAVTSGNESGTISLHTDTTTIAITVTAQDGTTIRRYVILITSQAPPPDVVAFDICKEMPINSEVIVVHQNVSPNGDGNSDVLTIDGITNYPDNLLQLMSRNGKLVFEAKGYDNMSKVFDGHGNDGKLQQPGTYFYSLEYKAGSEVKRKTGFIVLKY